MVLHGHAFCPLSLLVQAGWLNPTEIERRSRERTVGEGEEKKRGGGEKKKRGKERRRREEGRRGEEEKEERKKVLHIVRILYLCMFIDCYLSWFPCDFCTHYFTLSERVQDKLF